MHFLYSMMPISGMSFTLCNFFFFFFGRVGGGWPFYDGRYNNLRICFKMGNWVIFHLHIIFLKKHLYLRLILSPGIFNVTLKEYKESCRSSSA